MKHYEAQAKMLIKRFGITVVAIVIPIASLTLYALSLVRATKGNLDITLGPYWPERFAIAVRSAWFAGLSLIVLCGIAIVIVHRINAASKAREAVEASRFPNRAILVVVGMRKLEMVENLYRGFDRQIDQLEESVQALSIGERAFWETQDYPPNSLHSQTISIVNSFRAAEAVVCTEPMDLKIESPVARQHLPQVNHMPMFRPQDNEHYLSGYRINVASLRSASRSFGVVVEALRQQVRSDLLSIENSLTPKN